MNSYISTIQSLLKNAGFYTGEIDGIAGKLTVEAVEKAIKTDTTPCHSGFKLSNKSLSQLQGVNPKLVSVVKLAIEITKQDFLVMEGLRTKERQAEMVKKGTSKTMNSKHLGGNAVDLVPVINGKVSWDWNYYYDVAIAIRAAAEKLNTPIKWGGNWAVINGTTDNPKKLVDTYVNKRKKAGLAAFIDGPHYELA